MKKGFLLIAGLMIICLAFILIGVILHIVIKSTTLAIVLYSCGGACFLAILVIVFIGYVKAFKSKKQAQNNADEQKQ